MTYSPAILVLADGTVFNGYSLGIAGHTVGELVFNTGMTGYQEILTDPSYAKQIVLLTSAHIGNTGCNLEDMESSRAWAAGLIVRDANPFVTHYRADQNLPDWLKKHDIVAIGGIDTRALTAHIRTHGAQAACIMTDIEHKEKALAYAKNMPSLNGVDLAKVVSRQTFERWYEGQGEWAKKTSPLMHHVVVYDFGVKQSILKILHDRGCHITLVPAQTSAAEVLALNPDGIVLSNGPGDPAACDYAIHATQQLLNASIPILGICLGFQILGLACGGQTFKMKFGHHGVNHPVMDIQNQRVWITSQNHGFAIDEKTLPSCLSITHRSLFDQTLQGIMHKTKPALGFQGHPEAGPGPHDAIPIFDTFIQFMVNFKTKQHTTRSEGELSL